MSKRTKLEKKDWISSFTLIGTPKINPGYTFKIDEKSEKSKWVYNAMNLGVDCGEKHGVVYAEMMGGYNSEKAGVIFAHGKNSDGTDDFSTKLEIAWEDRFDENILADVGDLCFITVGLEKTDKGKTFYKKFLSAYDAVAYINEHLSEDMVVNVRGTLKYSTYNDKTQVRKVINSIALSRIDDSSKYSAKFMQSLLLTKDCVGELDKSKGILPIYAQVLDYVKELNGREIKGQIPFEKMFEYEVDVNNTEAVNKLKDKVFKVRKNVTQITFNGDLIEGGAMVTATMDDVPDDIKELIEIGVYTEEEALAKCSENGNREQRMVLRKPEIKMVGEEGKKVSVLQIFANRYTEEELLSSKIFDDEDSDDDVSSNSKAETVTNSEEGLDWLNNL